VGILWADVRRATAITAALVALTLVVRAVSAVDASPEAPAAFLIATDQADAPAVVERASDAVVARSIPEVRGYAQRATTDLDARFGGTTAPASIVEGGEVPVDVRVTNTGSEPWRASGEGRIRLGYHWYDGNGSVVVWDGARADIAADVPPGRSATFTVRVRAPRASGTFYLDFDLVQEGRGWASARGVAMKVQPVVVSSDGVTLYGKGWGHGIGFSQWGAQGWAEGAAGVRLTGEQIVTHYFPGAQLGTQPASLPFRVLLSAPSTGCVGRTIQDYARMWSAGGLRVVDDLDPTNVYSVVGPNHALRFYAFGNTLIVEDEWSGATVVRGPGAVTVVPTQWWDPVVIDQKDLAYRGNLKVGTRDDGYLRVVNYVSSDDYMRGALPGEMPNHWEIEALRAQAITARTYAAWRQSTAGDRTWDVRDDTADQCYGGRTFEATRTNAAVASTAGKILIYDGAPIRALYSSAHGGVSESVGCLLDAKRVGTTWTCVDGWPYLAVVDDPAEALAYDIRGGNPHDVLWSAHFSGPEIRDAIIEDYGVDIGNFVAMEFNMSPGGRPVSVQVRGSDRWVDLKGDRFLRNTLGLKSTLVRTVRF
jgi:stage II sporulation protein D